MNVVAIARGVWAVTLPLLLALLTAIGTGIVAMAMVIWKVGVDGHLSVDDKHLIAHAFFTPIFAVFQKTSWVSVDQGWD